MVTVIKQYKPKQITREQAKIFHAYNQQANTPSIQIYVAVFDSSRSLRMERRLLNLWSKQTINILCGCKSNHQG